MYAARRKTGHKTTRAPRWWVWLAYADQEYGGPEEGGWWYEATAPATDLPQYQPVAFHKRQRALREVNRVRRMIDKHQLNEGKRPTWSVLSRGDWLVAEMAPSRPHRTPTRRPHYE